ncbi:hypothetical protein AKJ65_02320 [candidate division MSBL1 archaeon SCGC-AAA259E19]|uniref:Uncharacterized protein n=1 Tax=candidate division MSBL1 archaeon SCGC-AAA259E19 TaxID=1698264 RepID=A0A133UM75_9EURY|nr:hypothetical protein AKJ65_02320 [candidate division MSBL1 archaeon SCGC-AAA259E19]
MVRERELYPIHLPKIYDEIGRQIMFETNHNVSLADIRALLLSSHLQIPVITFDDDLINRVSKEIGIKTIHRFEAHSNWLAIRGVLQLYRELSFKSSKRFHEQLEDELDFPKIISIIKKAHRKEIKNTEKSTQRISQGQKDSGVLDLHYLGWNILPCIQEYQQSGTVINTRTDVVDTDYIYRGYSLQDITDIDYKIEWTTSDTDYKIEWITTNTTTRSDWFDTQDGHSGTVIDTQTTVVDTDYIVTWTRASTRSQTYDERADAVDKKDTTGGTMASTWNSQDIWVNDHWEGGYEYGWFETRSDAEAQGEVVNTRTEVVDTDYVVTWTRTSSHSQTYEEYDDAVDQRDSIRGTMEEISDPQDTWIEPWTTTETRSGWFDTRDAHRGTVVDTRESGTYDYRYEWKTNEENTYSDWFDTRDGHPGTVVDENLVDTDYRLSWTENLSQAFSLSEEGSAKQLRSQVNGTLTTGQAYVGDYDYGVIWEGPALVEKVQENVYSATYTRGDWKTKTTTVTVTAKNNYSDDVYLSLASDPGVASSLGDHSLSLSSSARTGLTMEPIGTASTHSVTVTATDSKGKGKETISYTLNLTEEDKPSGTWTETSGTKEKNLKASTSLLVWALEPVHTEIVGRWGYEEFPTTITVNGEVWTEDGRENRNPGPGSYRVKFGSVDGLVAPGSREVFLHPGENKSVVGRYELKDMTFYDLRINLDPSEGGSTDPKGDYTRVYEDGTAVDITATSEEGEPKNTTPISEIVLF